MDTSDATTSRHRLLLRSVDVLTALFCLILVGRHINSLADPWDNSHCGVNSGAYYGYACKGIDAFGPANARLQGPILFHPDGTGLFLPYTNHPGTIYAIIYPSFHFLGKDERSLRLPILVVLIFNLLIFRFGLARLAGPLVASVATLGFATLPMIFQFGKMVDIPLFCLAFFIPVTLSWLRYRKDPSPSHWRLFAIVAFTAGLFDWFCYFLGVAIVLDVVFSSAPLRAKLRLCAKGLVPFCLSFLLVFSWLLWAEGSFERLNETMMGLLRALGILDSSAESDALFEKITWSEWRTAMGVNASLTTTVPFLLFAGFGIVTSILRSDIRKTVLRPGLMLLAAGLLPCLVFRTHATKHEFWPLVSLAGMCLFFGLGVDALRCGANRLKIRGDVVLVVVILLAGTFGVYRGIAYCDLRRGEHDQRKIAEDMNQKFTASDLVFTSDSLSPSRFYRDFVTVPQITNPIFLRHTLRNIRPHKGQFKRAFLLWNKSTTADWKWLTAMPTIGALEEVKYGNSMYYQRELDIEGLWNF